jgi:hypothetical protein
MKRTLIRLTLIAMVLLPAALAEACPGCKESIPNSADVEQASSLPGGFNASIYYMLIGVFGTAGMVIGMMVKVVRSSTRMPPPPPTELQ